MPEHKTDIANEVKNPAKAVVFFHSGSSGRASEDWLERLLSLGMPIFSHADYPGCSKTENNCAQIGLLLKELEAANRGCAVLLISTDLDLEKRAILDIAEAIAVEESVIGRTVLTNATPGLNPFAGLSGNQKAAVAQIEGIVGIFGSGVIHPHFQWPDHFIALSNPAVQKMAGPDTVISTALACLQEAGGSLEVFDLQFAYAPGKSLFNTRKLKPHEAARPPSWGELSSRLQIWLKADCPAMSELLDPSKPTTLHLTHSWGGGVALWVGTFVESNQASNHLQLRSEGDQSGQGAGQRLSLYAANQLECPIASWWLQPPIQSIHDENPHYQEIIKEVSNRYGIGRIIVSSLVGQSLDILRTGIPTTQVLHDHFPLWPFLSAHPSTYGDPDGKPDIALALADRKLNTEFTDKSAASWQSIGEHYLSTVKDHQVKIAAPSQSVIDMQRLLDPGWDDVEIELIPHGFPAFTDKTPVAVKPRNDQRLRVVVLGRMQAGKGQKLLLEALPGLQDTAQIYLVGTGKSGEAFYGVPGVNVIIDYQREELPSLLAQIGPDVAALLSTVPETFSYTLSELHSLGIPVIATNTGSFPGRIEHGTSGWLIKPEFRAFVELIESLYQDRSGLESVRANISDQIDIDPVTMVEAFEVLCPPSKPSTARHDRHISLEQAQQSALAFLKMEEQIARDKAQHESAGLNKKLLERTNWALDSQRDFKEEQERRIHWVGLLKKEVAHLESEIDVQIQRIQQLDIDLHEKGIEIDRKENELDRVRTEHDETLSQLNQVMESSSWKITRPFRVLRRTAQNFIRSQGWNPIRWPVLISGLVRNLSTVGLRGTLMRMQFNGYQETPEPFDVDIVDSTGDPDPPAFVPCSANPLISIVIPAFNNWVYTAACLRSITDTHSNLEMEVILVDDESSDDTGTNASSIKGLKYFRNSKNLGFIGSCNHGAEQANGEFVLFLNNDTQVTAGWLEPLLNTFKIFPETGLVGSRLVYPDGTLQECGGIIFNDGSGWNYGRNDHPDKPEYKYSREVDYCSGACVMIRSEVFNELGGFSGDYNPAYYEDTDLAFKVRDKGLKVRVQPASTVIHHEGITSGTDTSSGIKKYQLVNQEKFKNKWATELRTFPDRIEDPTNPSFIRAAKDHHLKGRVLIIDATTPEPNQDSGSLRLTHVMRCFLDLGFGVTFFADNRLHAGRYTQALQDWGVEVVYEPWIESGPSFFRQRGLEFSYVIVSRHYIACNYTQLTRKFCPQAKFIFDTVDLHYLREQRLAELENSIALKQVAKVTKRSELAVIGQSDAVLVVSETEVDILNQDAPDAMVHVLSNIHEVPGRQSEFKDRSDMFFVGGYQHPPNVDAACWFVEKIWPLVREELPDVQFHLIGSKAPEKVSQLKGDGVVFHGFVEELDHYLDTCRLAVAPLRYGAGVKGKVNLSMSHGQPVVATPVAVEGLHAVHDREVLVAESEQDFANEIIRLYLDEELWNQISDAAIENVEAHFSVHAAKRSLESLLQKLS